MPGTQTDTLNTVSSDNFSALSLWFEEIWNGDEVSDFSMDLLDIIDQPWECQHSMYKSCSKNSLR